jgi:hypothetical protein
MCGKMKKINGNGSWRPEGKPIRFCSVTCANKDKAKEQVKKRTSLTCKGCGESQRIPKHKFETIVSPKNFFCKKCIQAGKRSFGNKYVDDNGYVRMRIGKQYPTAKKSGEILEHRYVMEQKLGRFLKPGEYIHHKNSIRTDNRPENLELWTTKHAKGKRVEDVVAYCLEMLKLYAPQLLKQESKMIQMNLTKYNGYFDLEGFMDEIQTIH